MADPKVSEPQLTSQGQIYGRSSKTDEKTPEIAPEYRGRGATPQQKEDESKPWISEGHTDANVDDQNRDELSRPQPDTYAQELNKSLGPITVVKDKIADTLETTKEKVSATSNSSSDTKNSATGMFSQYTQAAWDKMNDLKPTIGADHSAPMAAVSERGPQDASSIAENVKNTTLNVQEKILAAGGDDVFRVMADGGSTQDDAQKANMRVTVETLT